MSKKRKLYIMDNSNTTEVKQEKSVVEEITTEESDEVTTIDLLKVSPEERIEIILHQIGVHKDSDLYKILSALIFIKPSKEIKTYGLSYSMAISEITNNTGIKLFKVDSEISKMITLYSFNDCSIEALRDSPRDKISKEFLIKSLYEFIFKGDQEDGDKN